MLTGQRQVQRKPGRADKRRGTTRAALNAKRKAASLSCAAVSLQHELDAWSSRLRRRLAAIAAAAAGVRHGAVARRLKFHRLCSYARGQADGTDLNRFAQAI